MVESRLLEDRETRLNLGVRNLFFGFPQNIPQCHVSQGNGSIIRARFTRKSLSDRNVVVWPGVNFHFILDKSMSYINI